MIILSFKKISESERPFSKNSVKIVELARLFIEDKIALRNKCIKSSSESSLTKTLMKIIIFLKLRVKFLNFLQN